MFYANNLENWCVYKAKNQCIIPLCLDECKREVCKNVFVPVFGTELEHNNMKR